MVLPDALPSGQLQSILTLNQRAVTGCLSFCRTLFSCLRAAPHRQSPVQYEVISDSGSLTIPAWLRPIPARSLEFPMGGVPIEAGDRLAFMGEGIPLDIGIASDAMYYPVDTPPNQGDTITLGTDDCVGNGTIPCPPAVGNAFPVYQQKRTYSIAANVINTAVAAPQNNATAVAYGGVDSITISDLGSGYRFPTVDFDLPDGPDGVQAKAHVEWIPAGTDTVTDTVTPKVTITGIKIDNPGSGYSSAPNVVIRDGTIFEPISHDGPFTAAKAVATLSISSIEVDFNGSGYISAPTVTISDQGGGSGATATATVSAGGIGEIVVTNPGSGYITSGGMQKFQNELPMLCNPSVKEPSATGYCVPNNLGQYLPLAVPDTTTFTRAKGFDLNADYYVIALVQHREQMHSDLPPTLLREYVQLETSANITWSKSIALQTDLLDGTSVPVLMPDGSQAVGVAEPHYLGPVIVANKNRPVRIVFYNLLPNGAEGDLFIPTDSSMMGSGMVPTDTTEMAMNMGPEGSVTDEVRNPACTDNRVTLQNPDGGKPADCFKDNRATLHLHGGITPWISDGTPHQWITPADENTSWPQGVSVESVPDMVPVDGSPLPDGVPNCSAADDGCMTFYYTNQQSARLMFYHDHAWGITRLNVYAGEAAGYLIRDDTESKLLEKGLIPADEIPLIVQDRTFVPGDDQLAQQDPTWDYARWGGEGNLWYHHVYMPAQNPSDPTGMSAFGRWMYGPWFWPPADPPYGPIANPYFNMDPATGFTTPLAVPCSVDDPSTWQYKTDPYCEPAQIPGTPNISAGMEQFNDTPVVNGTAYPTLSVEPKSYRMRILNAANDRFFNLHMYVADPRTGTESEVALNPAELAAAQIDPNNFPTPDTTFSPPGPSWIMIGSEGGFLPAPAVIDPQPITWIIDPTRFDVGNVDLHSLLLAPAERADVVVDFSEYAGQTLILYNDAPAAFPARVSSYDYFTGGPDLSPVGAPTILPGYGPNTRTVMQIKVADSAPAPAFNLAALEDAFKHKADGSGVFEEGQHPIIVGQAAYNQAYGTDFAATGNCTGPDAKDKCDGMVRINQQGAQAFTFDTLIGATSGLWKKLTMDLEPKAIHDEMNSATFDEFGRMTANLGLEVLPASPINQNVVLYPYVNPPTELIDASNLPKQQLALDANGQFALDANGNAADVTIIPISDAADGSQIWKITHNGVDTHPIHFHLYDVQVLNRVTWDNIILPTEPSELGWKDTVRVSPLEDTIVALRPIIPQMPFELPNSIRPLNPMMAINSKAMFNHVDADGNPTVNLTNQFINFGWEYVYHCHILSHEEMDMMRPVSVAMPPRAADGLSAVVGAQGRRYVIRLRWQDNSIAETAYRIQRSVAGSEEWSFVGPRIESPLNETNTAGNTRTFVDTDVQPESSYAYRIVALNEVGYGGEYMSMVAQSTSESLTVTTPPIPNPPKKPTNLTYVLGSVDLTWTDNSDNETSYVVERRTGNRGGYEPIATIDASVPTDMGSMSYKDDSVVQGNSYSYRVYAQNVGGESASSNAVTAYVPRTPAAPSNLSLQRQGSGIRVRFSDNQRNGADSETGFELYRSTNGSDYALLTTLPANKGRRGTGTVNYTDGSVEQGTKYYYYVVAVNTVPYVTYQSTPSNPESFTVE